jgi:hypothetical protein
MTPPDQMERVQQEHELLNIGIAVFDPNIPESYDEQVEALIQPDVRRAEASYMPFIAKNLLQSTGNWGAVRVVPRPTHAVDVTVQGKIIESNGERMQLQISVSDARGEHWFTNTYQTLASKYAYDDSLPEDIDPFQAVYKHLANDMLEYRETLTDRAITEIRTTAEMKFARDFAPDAFSNHVAESDGQFMLMRLPAEDDPMLARVRQIREREYLFIDTLDDYYSGFHRQMYTSYQNWRKATYEEAIVYRELKAQARNRAIGGTAAIIGGVAAIYESNNSWVDASGLVGIGSGVALIKSSVAKRHEAEMHAEVMREVGVAAEAELLPYTIQLENQSVRLQGGVEEQYTELRRILRRIYYENLGLEPPLLPAQSAEDSS